MKEINIFLAGSLDLEDQRAAIEKRIGKLNNSAEFKSTKIILKYCGNSGDKQSGYNHIVIEDTDIVFFLFEENVGLFSFEELLRACIGNENNGRPEVGVFTKKTQEPNPQLKNLQLILSRTTGCYTIDYEDNESLCEKIEDRIRTFNNNSKPVKRNRLKYTVKEKFLYFAISFVIISATIFFINKYYQNKNISVGNTSGVLLLSGGGTIEGYLWDHDSIDIANTDGMVYVPMPSKLAWQLIYEEMSKLGYEPDGNRPYYPIILSSKKAYDDDFVPLEQQKEFKNIIGYVAEILIGYDTLQVTMSSDLAENYTNTITDVDLATLLSGKNGIKPTLFTTTIGKSGTYNQYQKTLEDVGLNIDSLNPKVFYRKQKSDFFNDGKNQFVVLGSNGYNPINITNVKRLKLINTKSHEHIINPLYIYTILYKWNDTYVVRDCVKDFLDSIGITDFPESFSEMPSSQLVHEYDKKKRILK